MEEKTQMIDIVETTEVMNAEVIYQQDKALIDMQIATAKKYPRKINKAIDNAIAIVTRSQKTAETCNYAVPRGQTTIHGKSVHLAKIVAQVWGNMRVEAKVVDTTDTHVISEAVCFDIENNLAIKCQVKRSIMQNEYKWDAVEKKSKRTGRMVRMNEDMVTITGNAANSIALRNSILTVVPTSVTDEIYEAALRKITGDISTKDKLIAQRIQVVQGLKDAYNITDTEILKTLNRESIDHIDGNDIVTLVGLGTSIKERQLTVETAFRSERTVNEEISVEDLQMLLDLKREFLKPAEIKDAERVISTKEKGSYKKIHIMLSKN